MNKSQKIREQYIPLDQWQGMGNLKYRIPTKFKPKKQSHEEAKKYIESFFTPKV